VVKDSQGGLGPFRESQDCVESCESGIGSAGGGGGGGVSGISDGKRLRGGVLRSRCISIVIIKV